MVLWSSSAPPGLPVAYWCALMCGVMRGAITLAVAAATMRLIAVPQAMGLILPLGF